LIIIGSILFLLLFGTGAFFLGKSQNNQNASIPSTPSPLPSEALAKEGTPDPTANWKTYTSNQLNLSFKYPEDPNGTELEENNNSIQVYRKMSTGPFTRSEFPILQVSVTQNNTDKTGTEWIENESDISRLLKEETYSEIKWQQEGNWYISSDSIATFGYESYAYGFFNKQIVKITTTNTRETLTQILSTFKFL
ncbi:hypothetical protein HYW54_00005, partial [Candidatus Gottesmanbacteria bacterium]|nr:hypothetical protein [Candidatus Gottesmanbacteria bacterium]